MLTLVHLGYFQCADTGALRLFLICWHWCVKVILSVLTLVHLGYFQCADTGALRLFLIFWHWCVKVILSVLTLVHLGYFQCADTGTLRLFSVCWHQSLTHVFCLGAQNPILELLVCVPGVTGVVITLALLVIVSSSMEVIRCNYWYTEQLLHWTEY